MLDVTITGLDDSKKTRRRCPAVAGKIRVCNNTYGYNGWLGLASINIDNQGHITRGTAKMNDSYSSYFASQDERNHVMCQEVGHLFGLGHTSEDGSTQNTCGVFDEELGRTGRQGWRLDQPRDVGSRFRAHRTAGQLNKFFCVLRHPRAGNSPALMQINNAGRPGAFRRRCSPT